MSHPPGDAQNGEQVSPQPHKGGGAVEAASNPEQSDLAACRAAFEAWVKTKTHAPIKWIGHSYANAYMAAQWEGWQGRGQQSKANGEQGWFIPLNCMTDLAQEVFAEMIHVIRHGGAANVVARVDAEEYRWECDGLKYAKLRPQQGQDGVVSEASITTVCNALISLMAVIDTDEGVMMPFASNEVWLEELRAAMLLAGDCRKAALQQAKGHGHD